jgi:hypothetical protein
MNDEFVEFLTSQVKVGLGTSVALNSGFFHSIEISNKSCLFIDSFRPYEKIPVLIFS